MIFVDTSVIIDVLEAKDSATAQWSRNAMADAGASGDLLCNTVVFAELAGQVSGAEALADSLTDLGFTIRRLELDAAYRAGQAFREYRRRGGDRRTILPDFLIGAHAAALGAKLLTRDKRKIASYFPDLALITPETSDG